MLNSLGGIEEALRHQLSLKSLVLQREAWTSSLIERKTGEADVQVNRGQRLVTPRF
jgi:hypothetical protein